MEFQNIDLSSKGMGGGVISILFWVGKASKKKHDKHGFLAEP